MLNHLLLGQILTRPNGFWRDPHMHDERHDARAAGGDTTQRRRDETLAAAPRPSEDHDDSR